MKHRICVIIAFVVLLFTLASCGSDGGTGGGSDKKGEKYCERLSRLMVALCEVAGIPARTVHHLVGGHVTTEVYIEGAWAYMDPRHGLFYIDEKGRILSVEEIVKNPEVIFNQPQWVRDMASPEFPYECLLFFVSRGKATLR